MEIKDLLRMAQRRWLTISLFLMVGLGLAAAMTYTQTPQYQSTARVFISTDTGGSAIEQVQGSTFINQRVGSYAQLATSRELMQRVISRLNLNLTPPQLASKISSSVTANTVIIVITVTDPSAETAQAIAKAESEELTKYLAEVETPADGSASPTKATVVDPAAYNGNQVSPKPALNMTIGGVLGLLVGLGTALLRELLDNTISSAEDVEATIDSPVLATIAYEGEVPKHPLLTDSGSNAPRAEAFRLLRTNLQFLNLDTRPRSLVITSAIPGEGKTSTATNLAIALSQTGLRVLLVDGDLRRPKVPTLLGLERSVGLTTVLVGRSELQESIQKHAGSGIYLLASGPIPPNPTEVLQSRAAQSLFERLGQMFDMVIIDAPPLLPVSDAAIMARDVDGAILVVRHGKTTKEQLRQARARLAQVDASLFGVAVNMAPRKGRGSYAYGYGYGYEYTPQTPQKKRSEGGARAATKS